MTVGELKEKLAKIPPEKDDLKVMLDVAAEFIRELQGCMILVGENELWLTDDHTGCNMPVVRL